MHGGDRKPDIKYFLCGADSMKERSLKDDIISKSSRNVSFDEKVRVVLVPSRIEYRHAKLIPLLWWNGEEYLSFQPSAYSELRLLSTSENIGMKEARTRLYQQQSTTDKTLDIFTSATNSTKSSTDDDFDSYFTDAEDMSSDDENGVTLLPTKKEEEVETDDIIIRTSFHKVSSLAIISASLQRHEIGQSDEDLAGMNVGTDVLPFPKVSSLDCIAATTVTSSQKTDTSTSSGAPQGSPPPSPSRSHSTWKSSTSSDENYILQLCVLCDKPVSLATGPKNRRKIFNKIFTGSSIALYSTILVVAFVVADRYFGALLV